MRRFHLLANRYTLSHAAFPFEDSGFVIHERTDSLEERPEVLLWLFQPGDEAAIVQCMHDLRPKVCVTIAEKPWHCPPALADAYDYQWIVSPTGVFSVGTTLDGKIPEPDWATYELLGPLTETACLKALANSLYGFLLEDIIKETAEWCGHMSSAVYPA